MLHPPCDFAYRVRLARGAAGFTQGALATAIGVHAKTVTAWETGKRKVPHAVALQRLCYFLHTTPEWLMHGQGEGPSVSINREALASHGVPSPSSTPASAPAR